MTSSRNRLDAKPFICAGALLVGIAAWSPPSAMALDNVRPEALCTVVDEDAEHVYGYFSGFNANNGTTQVPVGSNNHFQPPPTFRGQRIRFSPGPNHFRIGFSLHEEVPTWHLVGRTATALPDPDSFCIGRLEVEAAARETSVPRQGTAEWTVVVRAPTLPVASPLLPFAAGTVRLLVILPEGAGEATGTVGDGEVGNGCEDEDGRLSCRIGFLEAGGERTVHVRARVNAPGTARLTAYAFASGGRTIAGPSNLATAGVSVVGPRLQAVLTGVDPVDHGGMAVRGILDADGSAATYRLELRRQSGLEWSSEVTEAPGRGLQELRVPLGPLPSGVEYSATLLVRSGEFRLASEPFVFRVPATAAASDAHPAPTPSMPTPPANSSPSPVVEADPHLGGPASLRVLDARPGDDS